MIKIAFFDYDNTTFSHKSHSVPESTYVALEKLKENGIITCLSTGRGKYELDNYFDLPRLKFDYYILFNGLQIIDDKNNLINAKTMQGIDRQSVIRIFNEKKIPIVVGDDDDYYINFVNDQVIKTMDSVSSPYPKVHDFVDKNIYMCSIMPGMIDNLDELVSENFPNCYHSKWVDGSYDIVQKGFSKADAIDCLIDKLNIDIKDTISFGDSDNDVTMLKKTEISVAMANSNENVLKVASYITNDIDEDGIYNACKHFNLI